MGGVFKTVKKWRGVSDVVNVTLNFHILKPFKLCDIGNYETMKTRYFKFTYKFAEEVFMKLLSATFITIILSSAFSVSINAKEEHSGKVIHDENCLNCHIGNHDEKFYTRENRRIKDLKGLGAMVRMCDSNLGTALFDEDMEEITNYLNEGFYKFPRK